MPYCLTHIMTLWMDGLSAQTAAAQTLRHFVWEDDPAQRWQMLFLYAFAYAYAFAFGASLASFLNVVVYRLPRRLNLVRPGSRCPYCGTPIEARDNIPVLGWLALRGRCRTCGAPIAPRYLLIELAIGGLFVLLLHLAVFRGGGHLPGQSSEVRYGLTILYSSQTWELGRIALYHACLLSLLLVCGLIQYDRQRVPVGLWGLLIGIGLAAGLVWPSLRPLAATAIDGVGVAGRSWLDGACDGLCGLLLGAATGAVLSLAVGSVRRWPEPRISTVLAMTSIGVYLGWQAGVQVGLLTSILMVLVALAARLARWPGRLPPVCLTMATAWIYVPNWNWLHEMCTRFGGPPWPLYAVIGILMLSLAHRVVRPGGITVRRRP